MAVQKIEKYKCLICGLELPNEIMIARHITVAHYEKVKHKLSEYWKIVRG